MRAVFVGGSNGQSIVMFGWQVAPDARSAVLRQRPSGCSNPIAYAAGAKRVLAFGCPCSSRQAKLSFPGDLTASVRRHSGIQRHSPAAPKRAHLRQVAKQQECTRITPMDKEELKERIRVPLLGFSAVLISIVAFLLLLYAITVVIRFFFALGSLG